MINKLPDKKAESKSLESKENPKQLLLNNIRKQINLNKDKCYNKIGKLINDLFDFRYVPTITAAEQERTAITLYKVTARHISYVFTAFPRLKELPLEERDKIVKNFLKCVLATGGKNQGWEQLKISKGLAEQPLDIAILKSEVGKYVNLKDKNYKLDLNPRFTTPLSNQVKQHQI